MESNYTGLGGGNAKTKVHNAPSEPDKGLKKVVREQANIILVNGLADLVLYNKPKAIALLKRHNIKTKNLNDSITLGLTTGLVSGNKAFTDDLRNTLEEIGSLPKDSEQSNNIGDIVKGVGEGVKGSGGNPWAAVIAAAGKIVTGAVSKGMDKARAKLQGAKAYQIEVLKTMQEKIKAGGSNKRAIIWAVAIVTCIIIATVGYVVTKKT